MDWQYLEKALECARSLEKTSAPYYILSGIGFLLFLKEKKDQIFYCYDELH